MTDTTGVSGSAHWYVIHTYAGYENKVASDLMTIVENRKLQDMIMDVKIPTETVVETVTVKKDGVEQQVERAVEHKLFPGYVLVKMVMTNETWFIVRNTRGCTGFVGHDSKLVPDSKPVPLTDEEAAKWGVEMKSERFAFEVGEEVKVVDGSMSGHKGVVNGIDYEAKTATITLDMFGRKVDAEVDLSSVVPLN